MCGMLDIGKNICFIEDSSINIAEEHAGVAVLPVERASKDYLWKIAPRDDIYQKEETGIFLNVKKDIILKEPLYASFLIHKSNRQIIHNVIVIESGASAHIFTGCASRRQEGSLHFSTTEIYVKKGALLTYMMFHDWNKNSEVKSHTFIRVEEDATFVSGYLSLHPVKVVDIDSHLQLNGKNATSEEATVIYARENSVYNIDTHAFLNAPNTRTNIVSRNITNGGIVHTEGQIVANAEKTKGHLECDGLMLSNRGKICTIPALESNVADVELSHEAAVGKLSEEEIEYLMSRGISYEEAQSLIIKGFINIDMPELPLSVKKQIKNIINLLDKNGF